MGPPGDRTCYMSTERTEDFGWIVDLSWHGMQQGESEIVTTDEKKKENKCSQHLGTSNAESGDFV